MLPNNRVSTHPGEMLNEEFIKPEGMTQTGLARHLGIPVQRINEIVQGKRGITPETAWLLAQALGTSPEFWMNCQSAYDLTKARADARKVSRFAAPPRGISVPASASDKIREIATCAEASLHHPNCCDWTIPGLGCGCGGTEQREAVLLWTAKVAAALSSLRRPHDRRCTMPVPVGFCDCGADEHNANIDSLELEIEQVLEMPTTN